MIPIMNKKSWLIGMLCVLVLGEALVYFSYEHNKISSKNYLATVQPQQSAVVINNAKVFVTRAVTAAEVTKGLSGTPNLPTDHGMLFIFKSADHYRFWMPDMNFPLDIIWIGADRKVVDISKNVPPLADKTKPVYYRPIVPAKYVLEVNAGWSDAHGIAPGEDAQFLSI